ncbi:ferrous iron transporter B [Candidatus Acetothermia bacterium]|nr:ferrous iron transporter B [Candidatus Acetothermia bacterium]MCI2427541.1 ferrous iron transporter B [Candidatus Acetothermia bacterium]MCI2428032.1 ferrous iron transporter B [Candidatus Acetothermia bacterium]
MKILLMGNPNVGKSVLFSRLTGINVVASNYPGTTVTFRKGTLKFGSLSAQIIDVPGAYTLDPTNKAEEIAVEMVKEGDVVINVIDATHLERNLRLTLELLEQEIPMVVALNLWDEAKHKGVTIDVEKLEELLGVPVVPTVAVTGEGIKELVLRIPESRSQLYQGTEDERWSEIGNIVRQVQTLTHRHHTLRERIEDAAILPSTGIPVAIIAALVAFGAVIGIGMGLRQFILLPFFETLIFPPIRDAVTAVVPEGFIREILIGHFGVLIDGIGWPLALVLPYLLAFYLVLAILEDTGYLPRLACMLDTLFHKSGVHGGAVIPFLLGFGCTIGGILSTRMLETRRERIIVVALMCLAIPCAAQTGAIIALLAEKSIAALAFVYLIAFLFIFIVGMALNRMLPGTTPSFLMEIPPYRIPNATSVAKKVWMHLKSYLLDAVPLIIFGVFIAAMLYESGALYHIGLFLRPIVVDLLGLPAEASVSLILGIVRRELAVTALLGLDLTLVQLIVGAIVALFYIPCAAVLPVLMKEFGVRYAVVIAMATIVIAFIMGGMLNVAFTLFL